MFLSYDPFVELDIRGSIQFVYPVLIKKLTTGTSAREQGSKRKARRQKKTPILSSYGHACLSAVKGMLERT
jgi:hypothetical protein